MAETKRKRSNDREKRDQNLHVRCTKSQMEFLDVISYEFNKTKTDMIWKALEFYRNCNKPPLN